MDSDQGKFPESSCKESGQNIQRKRLSVAQRERRKRRKTSPHIKCYHEHQVLGPGPERQECAKAVQNCKKNPGHKNFIPLKELTTEKLPAAYQKDPDVLKFIQVVAGLTVRLRVSSTSRDRPDGGVNYGARDGGPRTGTGYIKQVKSNRNSKSCSCPICEKKPEGRRSCKSWKLRVYTAKHVVFDEDEAKETRVDLFYDDEESLRNNTKKTFSGGVGCYTTPQDGTDWCWLEFTTCDTTVVEKLEELTNKRRRLGEMLVERFWSVKPNKTMWIVSHPHGIAKHVTFGEIIKEENLGNDNFKFEYTADTCSGSSGAAVWQLKHRQELSWEMFIFKEHDSGSGQQVQCSDLEADQSVQEIHNSDIDVEVPMTGFNREHLLKRYQNNDEAFRFIRVVADLTVRLRVGRESLDRPNGDTSARTGTGFVWDIWPNDKPTNNRCHCSTCSENPEEDRQSWRFLVGTEKQLVFDDSEAMATEVDLVHDSEDSSQSCAKAMKTVQGGKVWYEADASGWCRLMFTTCDSDLVTDLRKLCSLRSELGVSLLDRYQPEQDLSMVWVVYHPHGAAKHVMFGEAERKERHEEGEYQCTFHRPDRPGIIGARVWKIDPRGKSEYKALLDRAHHCMRGGEKGSGNVGLY